MTRQAWRIVGAAHIVVCVLGCGRVSGNNCGAGGCLDGGVDGGADSGPPDTEPPRLLGTTPADQDASIEPAVAITATFSEAIAPGSATATSFRLAYASGEAVPGTITVDGAVVTFTPNARLAPGSVLEATLTAGITDQAGNALASGATWTFETRAGAWTGPLPLESSLDMSAGDLDVAQAGDYAIAVWRMLSCSGPTLCGPDSELWASIYHDGTWSPVATVTATNVIKPAVAINRSGTAMVVWYDSETSIYANYFDGTSWSGDLLVETEDLGQAQAPQVAMDEDGKAYAVWHQADASDTNVWANVFDGSSWGTAQKLELSPDYASNPGVAVAPNGTVVAVWAQGGQQWGNDFTNGSWGGADLLGSDDGYPTQLVVGPDGIITAVWGGGTSVYASRFTGSWTSATPIDSSDDLIIVGSDLAINGDGDIIAVWLQGPSGSQHVWHARFTAPSTWSAAAAIESNGGAANGPGVAYGAGGVAMAIWRQPSGGSTSAWFNRYDPGDGWGSPQVIDPDGTGTAVLTSIFFDPGTGTFHAVWLQSGTDHTSPLWSQFQ
jgi:hypothetical protein